MVWGKHRSDGIGKAFEAIHNGNQNIGNAAVLEFVHDLEPEIGAYQVSNSKLGINTDDVPEANA